MEQAGVQVLFNQASTGRVSGITYLMDDFKAKGQALGNRFKWANIIKTLDYEQTRDSKEISQANSRARAQRGEGKQEVQQTLDYIGKTLLTIREEQKGLVKNQHLLVEGTKRSLAPLDN